MFGIKDILNIIGIVCLTGLGFVIGCTAGLIAVRVVVELADIIL